MASIEPTKFTWRTNAKGHRVKVADRESRWVARWRSPDGKSCEKWFERKVDAERHLTSVENSKLSGAYVDPRAGLVTLRSFGADWLAGQVWRPSTRVSREGHLENHIYPRLGDRPIGAIQPSEVQAFVKSLSDTMKPGTVGAVYGTLVAVYRTAVRDRVIASSPCTGIKLPRAEKRAMRLLTVEQIEAVAEAVGDRYRPLVVVAAGAGLRVGEALGLTVDSIDFMRRRISVTQQAVTVRKMTTLGPPKTSASVREVPIGAAVADELAAWLAGNPRKPGELLVHDAGEPVPQNRFSQTWARAVVTAGLPKGTRFHDLRHTYASALIAAGCSVKAVQAALGHESAAVTLDTYSHLWPSDEDRTRDAIDAFLRGSETARGADVGLAT